MGFSMASGTLAGLSNLELGRLRLSVGYGTHKNGRPMSPMEVAALVRRAVDEGESLEQCASAMQLAGTGHIGRFLHVLDLPEDIRYLVDWGAGANFIGFTAAVELAKVRDSVAERTIAEAILAHGLNSKEVRQVAQLLRRSGKTVEGCIEEVLGMRKQVDRRYVFIGTLTGDCIAKLDGLNQVARDEALMRAARCLGLGDATGKLGERFFTLTGSECFGASIRAVGRETIEARIREHIAENVGGGQSSR